jgi:hypothetical protein
VGVAQHCVEHRSPFSFDEGDAASEMRAAQDASGSVLKRI